MPAGTACQVPFSDIELKNINAYADMIRKDLRSEKRAVIRDSIGLDAAQEPKFWAVYDEYEKEFKALWDRRLANTKRYADHYEKMTDAVADQLALAFLKNDEFADALRAKYYARLKDAVGARLAARFLHVESSLDRLLELQVLAQIPLVP